MGRACAKGVGIVSESDVRQLKYESAVSCMYLLFTTYYLSISDKTKIPHYDDTGQ